MRIKIQPTNPKLSFGCRAEKAAAWAAFDQRDCVGLRAAKIVSRIGFK
jgi:hypothetical protein